uniref:Amidase domain-containing protein n=1 Tax=Paramoeba aestuarina TaxID=180227 RepID=A0A7S4KK19_9EUKA|mmetsp:Transcript_20453/g.31928  ORF Transcript_20453/g.31928 Transcript_20453/m.31928 type:complete len:460 (+) Transcript_20453:63-1442(+)
MDSSSNESYLSNSDSYGEKYGLFVSRRTKEQVEECQKKGEQLPLKGAGFLVKDNIHTCLPDLVAVGASNSLVFADKQQEKKPELEDSPVVRRLIDAGGAIIGTVNMHELAFGISSTNGSFGAVRNPYNPARIPGGSSGASAAAIALGCGAFSLGTDTGGSVRIPSAFCGTVGLRPTTYTLAQQGVVPIATTTDTIGPIANTVDDVHFAYSLMLPPSSSPPPTPSKLVGKIEGVRVGVPRGYFYEMDEEVEKLVEKSIETLKKAGAVIVEEKFNGEGELVNQGIIKYGFDVFTYEWVPAFKAYLERNGRTCDMTDIVANIGSPDVKGLGENQLGKEPTTKEAYEAGLAYAEKLKKMVNEYFDEHKLDCLVMPTCVVLPPEIGQEKMKIKGKEIESIFAVTHNSLFSPLTATPALSVPAGIVEGIGGVGIDFVGRPGSEFELLAIGKAFEEARGKLPSPPV